MKTYILSSLFFILLFLPEYIYSQADAGTDQEICTNNTYLSANLPSGYTGEWSILSGNCTFANQFSNTTYISNISKGINKLRWTINNGGTNLTDDVIITNSSPTIAVTASDASICEDYYTLNANSFDTGSGETGTWSLISGGGILATPNQNYTDVTNLPLGTNEFKWEITKSICSSWDNIIITNNHVSAFAGIDETTCNDFTNLTGNDPSTMGATGSWSVISSTGNPVFTNLSMYNTTVTNLGVNGNSLKWEVTNGLCNAQDFVIITSDKPSIAIAGADKIICTNSTSISANNPSEGTGVWSLVSGAGVFSNPNNYNSNVSSINVGINEYKWKITKNGCSSEDNIEVFYNLFEANAGIDDETCLNSYTLAGNNVPNTIGTWRVVGGAGTFTDENSYNTEVSSIGYGSNTYEWKLESGACESTDYVTIARNSTSIADAGSDKETCDGNINLSATSPAVGTGSWTVVEGTGIFANSLQSNTSVSNIGIGQNNKYRWTVTYATCSNYDDVIVLNNFVTTDAGADQTVCGTTSLLNANPTLPGETGSWEIIEGGSTVINMNLHNSSVENLSSGNNRFKWTLEKGNCSANDEITITNNKYNASASISGPSDICSDFSSINGNFPPAGGTAFWTIETGSGIFDNSADNSTVVRNLSLGENKIHWIINKDGCEDFDEIIINRNTVFSDAGSDVSVCDSYVSLNAIPANAGETGSWTVTSGSGIISDVNSYNTNVTNLNLGTNTFTWTIDGLSCSASDNVIITNNKFYTNTSPNQHICENTISISATNPSPGYGNWELISGTGVFTTPSNHNTTVTNIGANTINKYRWHAFNNGCTAISDIEITNNLILANAGTDFTVCVNSATLNADIPVEGTGTWTNQYGSGIFADNDLNNTTVSDLSLGTNTFRWTVTNLTCVSFDDVSVINNGVSVSAGANQEICNNFTQLSGGQPPVGEIGLWEIVSGSVIFENSNLYNTNITEIQEGINVLKWTINNSGCTSDESEVTINNKSFTADAGEDQELDAFITSTNLNSTLPVGASAYWTLVGGFGDISDINNPNTEVTNMQTGVNQFLWTVEKNGCTSDDVVKITVVNFTPNAGIDRVTCTDSIKLSAANYNGTPQVWTVVEGSGTFVDANSPNTWVKNIGVGINKYKWSVTINDATATDEMLVTRVIADAGEDQTLTENFSTLNGNPPNNNCIGQWDILSGSGSFTYSTLFNTPITNLNSGINTLQWTITSNECQVSDIVLLTVVNFTPDAGSDKVICADSIKLNAANYSGATQSWSVIQGSGIIIDEHSPNTWVKNLSPGDNIFKWTVIINGVEVNNTVTITRIVADAGEDQNISSTTTILNGNIPTNNFSGFWTLSAGSSVINTPTLFNTIVSNLNIGDNIFKWTLMSSSCNTSDYITVNYDGSATNIISIKNKIKIYPNPIKNNIFIENNSDDIYNLTIYNLTGKIIYSENNIFETKKTINFNSYSNGFYFLRIIKNGNEQIIKLIKK